MAQSAAVIGAGIVGATTALALQQAGWHVELFERGEPGGGCSFGNAGLVTPSLLPLASPATLRRLGWYLTSANSPIRLEWTSLGKLMPWGIEFIRACSKRRFEQSTRVLNRMAARAHDAYQALLMGHARPCFRDGGYLIAYVTDKWFRKAVATARLRRRHGAGIAVLSGAEARKLEPGLGPLVVGAIHIAGAKYVIDPQGLVALIVDQLLAAGGRLRIANVQKIVKSSTDGPVRLLLVDGEVRVDLVVVAAGWETKDLVTPIGLDLPIACERGYHAMLQAETGSVTYPVMSGEGAFVLTPMRAGLRLAGMSEFASATAPPQWNLLERALRQARQLCPDIRQQVSSRWVGARPATPDALPIVGRVPGERRVTVNTGHGHAGLSLAAVTAQMTVELANGGAGDELAWPRRYFPPAWADET